MFSEPRLAPIFEDPSMVNMGKGISCHHSIQYILPIILQRTFFAVLYPTWIGYDNPPRVCECKMINLI